MKTWQKVVMWISIVVFLLAGIPLVGAGIRSGIVPLWKWGFNIKDAPQNSAAVADYPVDYPVNYPDSYAPAPATSSAPVATDNDNYIWGWAQGQTKYLLPGYVGAGDIYVDELEKFLVTDEAHNKKMATYFDEGGINEATLVLNLSSRQLSVFAEFGSGEYTYADKNYSIVEMVSAEFRNGGDPDADTVRLVVVTDIGVTQTWYDTNLNVIDSITRNF